VSDILTQLYEAWNGSGLPLGLRRTEIRMGARILALLDSFLDLTQNPNNCIGRKLSSQSALNMLKAQSGSLFDPDVVRLLEMSRKGEGLRRRLRSNGRQILLALSNETLRNEVSEALLAREWPTHAVSKLDGVAEAVLHREADALVLDASFSIGELASLFKQVRGAPECAGIPIFVLGIPRELDVKERLESAQVTLLALPQTAEALAKSIDAAMVDFVALGAAGRVVNGSFDELPLAELLRALDEQQKSGRLVIQTTVEEGSVFLEEGRAIWARFHQHRGLEALHNLTESTPRAFSFDPEALSFDLPHMNVSFSEWLSTHPST
jgi:hypothetical protein